MDAEQGRLPPPAPAGGGLTLRGTAAALERSLSWGSVGRLFQTM